MVKLKEYTDKQLTQLQAELILLAAERRHEQNTVYKGLQDQIDRRFFALERETDQRFTWVDGNTSKALTSMDERLQVLNGFRGAMSDQSKDFIHRVEVERQFDAYDTARNILVDRVTNVEKANSNFQGRMWAIGVGMSIMSIGVGIALHFIH